MQRASRSWEQNVVTRLIRVFPENNVASSRIDSFTLLLSLSPHETISLRFDTHAKIVAVRENIERPERGRQLRAMKVQQRNY